MKLQCKHIPDQQLDQLSSFHHCILLEGYPNSVQQAMPANTPQNLVRAKMASLIRRGLVDGCGCGCRGDFMITDKGRFTLADLRDLGTA